MSDSSATLSEKPPRVKVEPLASSTNSSAPTIGRPSEIRKNEVEQDWWIEVLDKPQALRFFSEDILRLANESIEPNAFYEPWYLLPGLEHLGTSSSFQFVFVYRKNPRKTDPPILCGFFPLVENRLERFGVRTWALWSHDYNYLCTPFLKLGYAEETLAAFFQWTKTAPDRPHLIDFSLIPGDGPFASALAAVIRNEHLTSSIVEQHPRAVLRVDQNEQDSLDSALNGHSRRELRRQKRRLSEAGQLEFRALNQVQNVNFWIDQFLDLEAAGWKGREGTAINHDETPANFFKEIAAAAFKREQLQMMGLFLDGEPIAMKCNLMTGNGGFAFKIAFDERYQKFSPGVQLEVENIRHLHEGKRYSWMDSCAVPQHFMINRLWKERRIIQRVLVSTGTVRGDMVIGTWPLLRVLKKRLKGKQQ